MRTLILALTLALFFTQSACSVYAGQLATITFRDADNNNRTVTLTGDILGRDEKNLVIHCRDGQYRRIPLTTIEKRERVAGSETLTPYTTEELELLLADEFPASAGFAFVTQGKYLLVYNTSLVYAEWCARLLDRLAASFVDFWGKKGVELHEPEFPLVVVVLANRRDFEQYARSDEVDVKNIIAYYNKLTNRIAIYDISGLETERKGDSRSLTRADLARMLDRPAAGFNIGTIIHEAVHQVAYNCGFQNRLSPFPVWLNEGIAQIHEVPSRDAKGGWNINVIANDLQLRKLNQYLSENPVRPLETIIRDDAPLRGENAGNNYAMAWGLTYYLLRRRPKDLVKYIKLMQTKTIENFRDDTPEKRQQEFESIFGGDWNKLYKECGNYMRSLMQKM